ncbi:MAG TPA: TonB-dependent receptor, partial [Cytophagaceae bacterium]
MAKNNFSFNNLLVFLILYLVLLPCLSLGQVSTDLPIDTLKKLSLEELMNIEITVTSVSRQPEKLSEVASAIQVITRQDILRSGATSLPEALRLASNLQVSQINSYAHVISARGFNAIFSNKFLVMIDGRVVYSPLFAGVFWDAQSVLLEDIERIEVISGPGVTAWGANAVNGVINIITRSAKDSQGLYLSASKGTFLENFGAARYGGKISDNFHYRIYAQHFDRSNTFFPQDSLNTDKWRFTQTGFRSDWQVNSANSLILYGNLYFGKEYTFPSASSIDGQNVLARWTHNFSDSSQFIAQAFFDRTWREDIPSTISDELYTYDIEFQHQFYIKKRHNIIWGGGYRFMADNTINATPIVGFVPAKRNMPLYSSFIQDEISLMKSKLKFIIGTKLQHNVFTDFEIQPNVRFAWTPIHNHTVWGAVSRAIRAPSRIDVDYHIPVLPVPPTVQSVAGGPNFRSETLIAYELGYRFQPTEKLSLSLASFYNFYDNLYTVEALPGTLTYQIQNGALGETRGIELSGAYQLLKNWRLRGGYTYFHKDLRTKPEHT